MATASKKTVRRTPARKPAAKAATPPAPPAGRKAAAGSKAAGAKPKDKSAGAAGKAKPKKAKLVRDSFNIPKSELVLLEELKARAARLGQPAKKSEVLRAGVKALAALGDTAFLATVTAIGPAKPARTGPARG